MVRVFRGVGAGAALAAFAGAVTVSVASPAGISLELHRLPSEVVSRNAAYQRQRRLKADRDSFESVPLHLGMGTHYTWVYAGTPPQRASVITDTGSSLMAFPCAGCTTCGTHTDKPFDTKNSSTLTHVTCSDPTFFRCQGCGGTDSTKNTCEISQSYMEGSSWHASVVEDIVYLGGEDSFHDVTMRNTYGTHFRFGCQMSETGLFITQVADGIMGLANNDNHIVAKLFKEKKIANKLFSLCFAAEGGSMAIGAPDTSRHKGKISYAKLVGTSGHNFYGVELREVRIAGTRVEASAATLHSGQFIVDSGTTDSYLPSSMKQAFLAAFKQMSGLDYQMSSSACQGYTDEHLEKLPNIEIVLGAEDGSNMTLVATPDQYLVQEGSGKYCGTIFLSEASGGVIGANIMLDHDVIFDQGNQRVGFVEANCDFLPASNASAGNASVPSSAPTTAPAPTAWVVVNGTASTPTATKTPLPSATEATKKPTEVPTSSAPPATTEKPKASESPSPAPSTSAPPATTHTPTTTTTEEAHPATIKTAVDLGAKTGTDTANQDDEDQPLVLTIVGTVLAVAFIIIAVVSIRRHKKTKRARKKYGRVKETEGDEDDDDEDDLIAHTPGQRRKTKKPKTSDSIESDDDDDDDADDDNDNVRPSGRVTGHDSDDDDDDDDIFDRDVDDHDAHKHDARMLEKL